MREATANRQRSAPERDVIVLVSPAPVDGYPPVQHQAVLLTRFGFRVLVLTSPLAWRPDQVSFATEGAAIVTPGLFPHTKLGALRRAAAFVRLLETVRREHRNRIAAEIAFEPLGILYSDFARFRPARRIAHFHESLERFSSAWIERRLRGAIQNFQLVVVPDEARGALVHKQLELSRAPTVVPNFPRREYQPNLKRPTGEKFEVIYSGSLGFTQKLDCVISSVALWPDSCVLTLLGNDCTETARLLKSQAESLGLLPRVNFSGWVRYEDLLARLSMADLGISLLDPTTDQWRTSLGASNKRYQYMQAGLPQIGDMNPGVAELLEGNSIGACVSSFEPTEIARAIRGYALDPERCISHGDRAYSLHQSRFNYESSFEPILEWVSRGR